MSGNRNFGIAIRRARIDSLDIYEISDEELRQLEHGSPESILLSFAIFCASVSFSFLITVITTVIQSDRLFIVFIIIIAIGFLSALVLFILWARHRQNTKYLIRTIRSRMAIPVMEEQIVPPD